MWQRRSTNPEVTVLGVATQLSRMRAKNTCVSCKSVINAEEASSARMRTNRLHAVCAYAISNVYLMGLSTISQALHGQIQNIYFHRHFHRCYIDSLQTLRPWQKEVYIRKSFQSNCNYVGRKHTYWVRRLLGAVGASPDAAGRKVEHLSLLICHRGSGRRDVHLDGLPKKTDMRVRDDHLTKC